MFTNVAPLTENGLSPAEDTTGGAGPPRLPLNVWTLVPEVLSVVFSVNSHVDISPPEPEAGVAATLAVALAAGALVAGASVAKEEATIVEVTWAGHAEEFEAADPLPTAEADPPTAASISSGVASFTRRFCEKIQPSTSSTVSQVFPAPVLSFN
jgi:hypothetical protein